MSDPIRWLDEGADAFPHERELLGAGRSMDPPPDAAEKIWAALGPHIGPGGNNGGSSSNNTAGNGSSGTGSSGTSIASAVGGVKGAAFAIASITAVAGAIAAFVMASPANPSTKIAPVHPEADAVTPVLIDDEPAKDAIVDPFVSEPIVSPPTLSAIPTDAPRTRTKAPRVSTAKPTVLAPIETIEETDRIRQERASRLREESRILAEARSELRSGHAASALEKLDTAGGRFPDGILSQEREVLAIEALARSGQRTAASARAAAFVQAYPTSPHAAKVRGFLQ